MHNWRPVWAEWSRSRPLSFISVTGFFLTQLVLRFPKCVKAYGFWALNGRISWGSGPDPLKICWRAQSMFWPLKCHILSFKTFAGELCIFHIMNYGSVQDSKHMVPFHVRYGFLLVCYCNFVNMTHRFWGIRLQKCRDLENRVKGPRKSLNISPYDTEPKTYNWCSIVTMAIACRFWDIQCPKISRPSIPVKSQSRSLKGVPFDRLGMVSY